MFQELRLIAQATIQSPACGDNKFLQTPADGENGNAPFKPGRYQRHAQFITPGIGVRLIAVFTIEVRLHIAWAAWQENSIKFREKGVQQFRLCQRVWQGDWQTASVQYGIQVLFLQCLGLVTLKPVSVTSQHR